MRLFIAVDVDEETRARVGAIRDALAPVLAAARVPPRVTWVREDRAHVTLRFIGEVADDVGAALTDTLTPGFVLSPFDVRWEQIGMFPGGRSPRVIWLGPTGTHESLAALATLVDERVRHLVGPGESRPFKPHLTVARIKDAGRGVDWRTALAHGPGAPTTTHVDHVTLYRSQLSSKGPTYTALCVAPLTGSRAAD